MGPGVTRAKKPGAGWHTEGKPGVSLHLMLPTALSLSPCKKQEDTQRCHGYALVMQIAGGSDSN